MNCFTVRKERPNRNTILHLQISHVVLYHWGLTTKKSLAQILVEESKRLDQEYRYFSISQL